ncbi:hypothetical protein AB0E96_20515 [Kitasatospora sp. NPDC036755]|uniref:hypothetical protein n=1 Tax=Kitasatospora sp. NPDC036755 TaxID=3154600 RepID=UPI0033D949EF
MTWRIQTRRLGHDGAGNLHVVIRHHPPHGTPFELPRLSPQAAEHHPAVQCPTCRHDRDLTMAGHWGEPALLTCPCGHSWTPYLPPLSPQALLREVVRQALDAGALTYREARTDPDTLAATPRQDSVRVPLTTASRSLNRRTWVFDDYEIAVATDLLDRLRPDDTETEAASSADRLRALHRRLAALAEYAAMANGPLGELLDACGTALRPARGLTADDLEPGPVPGNPPVLLDAELALGTLVTVLRAGSTGEVDY